MPYHACLRVTVSLKKVRHPGAVRAEKSNMNVMSTQSWTKHPGKNPPPKKLNKMRTNLSRFLRHCLNQSRMCVLSRGLTDKLCSGKISKHPTQTFFTYLPRKVPQKKAFGASWWMPNTLLDQTADMEAERADDGWTIKRCTVKHLVASTLKSRKKPRWTHHIQPPTKMVFFILAMQRYRNRTRSMSFGWLSPSQHPNSWFHLENENRWKHNSNKEGVNSVASTIIIYDFGNVRRLTSC